VSDRIDRFNGEITELQQLRARIENMPDGPDKNDLIIEYNRRNQALLEERDRIESAQADLIARKQSLDSAYGSLQQRNQDLQNRYSRLDAEKSALLRLREEIDKLEAQIRDHLQNDSGILQQIATIVEPL
jgi:chromosome segregation ATPase